MDLTKEEHYEKDNETPEYLTRDTDADDVLDPDEMMVVVENGVEVLRPRFTERYPCVPM